MLGSFARSTGCFWFDSSELRRGTLPFLQNGNCSFSHQVPLSSYHFPDLERTYLMTKYFGLLLLAISLFMVGCGGPQEATPEQASQGMDNPDNFASDTPAN